MEKRVFGYDAVRAIAILMVMVGHSLGFLYNGNYSFFLSFLFGFYGVELFFVLSGVLIGRILLQVFSEEHVVQGLKQFVIRRWLRTLPLYYMVLPLYYFGNRFIDGQFLNISIWKYVVFIQNFFTVLPSFFGVSWSLSVEEWFYILFPAFLLLLRAIFPKMNVRSLFLYGIGLFTSFFLTARILAFSSNFTFYEGIRKVAFYRLDAIAFGILAAVAMAFIRKKHNLWTASAVAGAGIFILNQYIVISDNYNHLFYFNTLFYSILGISLAMIIPKVRRLSSPPLLGNPITFISKISYSLYLLHWPVYKLLASSYLLFLPAKFRFLLFFVLSFICAAASYRLIEKPILKFRERMIIK